MNERNSVLRGRALKIALVTLLLGATGAAFADPFGIPGSGGVGDHHVKKARSGFAWDPNWTWWAIGDWHFALTGEAHLGWWHTNEGSFMKISASSV